MTAGVRQIVSFNWPFYAVAATAVVSAIPMIAMIPAELRIHPVLYSAVALAAFWLVASVAASWIVYDASELMHWSWINRTMRLRPRTWINIHAGLDQSTPILGTLFPGSTGRVFDIFHPGDLTEPSILRARRLAQNEIQAQAVDYRQLPVATGTIDAAFLLLSAHELRTDDSRSSLFSEIRRVLSPGGRAVVAEHLRDWPNFLAFGPGFLHFHSRRTWVRCFVRGGFAIETESSVTPFVRIFVLRRSE